MTIQARLILILSFPYIHLIMGFGHTFSRWYLLSLYMFLNWSLAIKDTGSSQKHYWVHHKDNATYIYRLRIGFEREIVASCYHRNAQEKLHEINFTKKIIAKIEMSQIDFRHVLISINMDYNKSLIRNFKAAQSNQNNNQSWSLQ